MCDGSLLWEVVVAVRVVRLGLRQLNNRMHFDDVSGQGHDLRRVKNYCEVRGLCRPHCSLLFTSHG